MRLCAPGFGFRVSGLHARFRVSGFGFARQVSPSGFSDSRERKGDGKEETNDIGIIVVVIVIVIGVEIVIVIGIRIGIVIGMERRGPTR